MPVQSVVLVGHCGFDSGTLTRFAGQLVPRAQVVRVNDQSALDNACTPGALLLINRVLDGRFDVGGSGVALIQRLAEHEPRPTMMLVSNYDDAQQQAVKAGALRGFGKSEIGDATTFHRLTEAIAESNSAEDGAGSA